jgi:hypothetical protein
MGIDHKPHIVNQQEEFVYFFDSRSGLKTFMRKESIKALPKVARFLRVLRFSPTGHVDRVGWA